MNLISMNCSGKKPKAPGVFSMVPLSLAGRYSNSDPISSSVYKETTSSIRIGTIGISLPPSCFQEVILPSKISLICVGVRFLIVLLLFTHSTYPFSTVDDLNKPQPSVNKKILISKIVSVVIPPLKRNNDSNMISKNLFFFLLNTIFVY
ncbi:hypothetical protein SDC9_172024 [bioreactor metagenome]|uniref:Uncharacterized protein n=1 Tax=bioreactor metagenome TaxID=1076179 RepID=A0A645GLM4_9ZZZZ